MSILTSRATSVDNMPIDGTYVIYGNNGTGKTVLASTFPKTDARPMLYLDILEGGSGSISRSERKNIQVVEINEFKELNDVLTDVLNGYTVDEKGQKIPVSYSTIVFDSATQLEFLLKKGLMEADRKDQMSLRLWGQAKLEQDTLWNICKLINKEAGSNVVVICHQKEMQDEENPGNNKIIPSLMTTAAYSLCAKASFVWYTKIENEESVGKDGKLVTTSSYVTYIDGCQAYLTKTRKPPEVKIPLKVKNMTYSKFKEHVLDIL